MFLGCYVKSHKLVAATDVIDNPTFIPLSKARNTANHVAIQATSLWDLGRSVPDNQQLTWGPPSTINYQLESVVNC